MAGVPGSDRIRAFVRSSSLSQSDVTNAAEHGRRSPEMATIPEPLENSGKTDLMRYGDAAAFLSIPVGSLYALVHHKRIPHFRLSARTVLFRRAEL